VISATETLAEGVLILEPVLKPAGFVFVPGHAGKSSGGWSASGSFVRGDRGLEIHYRYSLGLVTYVVGGASLSHSDYVRALGHSREAAYPGFSSDPLDGFRHLRTDLERFGGEFLHGTDAQFHERAAWVSSHPAAHGLAALDGESV
jgi:hypothetical protein